MTFQTQTEKTEALTPEAVQSMKLPLLKQELRVRGLKVIPSTLSDREHFITKLYILIQLLLGERK